MWCIKLFGPEMLLSAPKPFFYYPGKHAYHVDGGDISMIGDLETVVRKQLHPWHVSGSYR